MSGAAPASGRGGSVAAPPGTSSAPGGAPARRARRPVPQPPTTLWPPPPSVGELRDAVDAAAAASTAQDRSAATRALAGLLIRVDPDTAARSSVLVSAAACWAWLASQEQTPGPPPAAVVAWARFAFEGLAARCGPTHAGTCRAGYALATLLDRSSDPAAAATVYGQVVTGLIRAKLGDQADLVSVHQHAAAHAAGRCQPALDGLAAVWQRWRRREPDAQQRGLPIVVRLAAMSAACGLRDDTTAWWREAEAIINAGPSASRPEARLLATVVIVDTVHPHLAVCQFGPGPGQSGRPPGGIVVPAWADPASVAGGRP